MIDSKILKSLTSKEGNVAVTLLVTGYQQDNECNSESVKIKMHQVNKSISEIESGIDPVEKELIIQSALDFDEENGLFTTKLIGSSNIQGRIDAMEESFRYNSHIMEMFVAELADSIVINFTKAFNEIPSINITMDSKTKSLFNDYTYDFETHMQDNLYTGVTIEFTNLRKKNTYPEINILIIGDKIVQNNDSDATPDENTGDTDDNSGGD